MVSFDDPRPSIFSNWRICAEENNNRCKNLREDALKQVHKEINVGQVLNYSLVKGGNGLGSIRAFLLQQNWYVSAQTAFKGVEVDDKKTAETLCRNIYNEITGLGLNGEDAEIVIWAALKGLPQPNNIHANAYSAATCNDAISKIEADKLQSDADDDTGGDPEGKPLKVE